MTDEGKEKAIEYFKWWKSFNVHTQKAISKDTIAYKAYQTEIGYYDLAIKALEQEPRKDEVILTKEEYGELVSSEFDNGYAQGYREALEQEPVLDKIRAEIIEKFGESECAEECGCLYALLDIIDKYKGESEEV